MIRRRFAAVFFLGTSSLVGAAAAAPQYARLSYTADPQDSMTVTWNTTASTSAEVQLGTATGSYTKTVKAKSIQANAGLGYIHEVELTGLTPSTKYYYIAGSTSDGFTAEASFTTGPVPSASCGSMKFAFLADNRPDPIFGGGDNWPQIMGQAANHKPAFMLNGGDLVIDGDKIDQWLKLLGWTTAVAKSIPFMPAMGNHDTGPGAGDNANYNQIFALPRSTGTKGSNTEDYYYFTYGNAIFVALNTENYKAGSIPFADQAAWLDAVFTANPKKWKFVYFHKPVYTTGTVVSHPPNEENQNAAFVPVFDKHHVDVVFQSHNHWYERFEPSACATKGTPGSANPCSVGAANFAQGTVYIVSGGAGAFTVPALLCGSTAGRAKCLDPHHYVLVDIQNDSMKLETWGAFPQANQVIDTITVQKVPDPLCGTPPDAGVDSGSGGGGGSGGSGGAAAGAGGAAGSSGSAGSAGNAPDASAGGSGGGAGASAGGASSGGASSGGSQSADSGEESGCGCRVAGSESGPAALLVLSGLGLALARRRRR